MFLEEKKQGEVKPLDAGSKLLLETAELIEKRGLAKWFRELPTGELCFYGALSLAAYGHTSGSMRFTDNCPAGLREAHARMQGATGEPDVADWNNKRDRTKEEVVATLRAVALSGQC